MPALQSCCMEIYEGKSGTMGEEARVPRKLSCWDYLARAILIEDAVRFDQLVWGIAFVDLKKGERVSPQCVFLTDQNVLEVRINFAT